MHTGNVSPVRAPIKATQIHQQRRWAHYYQARRMNRHTPAPSPPVPPQVERQEREFQAESARMRNRRRQWQHDLDELQEEQAELHQAIQAGKRKRAEGHKSDESDSSSGSEDEERMLEDVERLTTSVCQIQEQVGTATRHVRELHSLVKALATERRYPSRTLPCE